MLPRVSIALLLLLTALGAGADVRKSRFALTNALSTRFENFIKNHIIAAKNITADIFQRMEKARQCVPLPEIIIKFLLKRIKLCYFYGDTVSQRIEVPIEDTASLVNEIQWKRDRPMAIYTFGWLNTPLNSYTKQIVKAYHANGGYNLVVVDWHRSGTFLEYGMAVTMVARVGQRVAQAVQELLKAGATLDHVVGHSLGAQVSGHIGRNLSPKPRFVVGLDPAGPLFYSTMFKCQDALSSNDGQYVVALHTDWNRLGANEMTGPADFMPHGGHRLQPGCSVLDMDFGFACSHNRAISIWCDAIKDPLSVAGRECYSYDGFKTNKCKEHSKGFLSMPNRKQGVFYITTNGASPFGKGVQAV